MAEFEFAGTTFRGGKMFAVLTALSTLGGGAWAGFEFYKDYMDMKEIESERDFYFEKLRGIEVMLQVYKEKEERGELLENGDDTKKVIDKIFKVMYAAMEDNVVVDDEGNVSLICD